MIAESDDRNCVWHSPPRWTATRSISWLIERTPKGVRVELEVAAENLAESGAERSRERDDDVDVVGRPRLAVERRREASPDEVGAADGLDRGRDSQRDVEGVNGFNGSARPRSPAAPAASERAGARRTAAASPATCRACREDSRWCQLSTAVGRRPSAPRLGPS